MAIEHYSTEDLRRYRTQASELAELRKTLGDTIGHLEPEKARQVFDELTLRTKEIEALKSSLGAAGVILAKYGVEVVNDHTVSFVLPKECSRIEILHEAQELVLERDKRELIGASCLNRWNRDKTFYSQAALSEHICIDGHVEGSTYKTRQMQIDFLSEKGLTMATKQDLVTAFALHWVATGEPLFRWWPNSHSSLSFDCRVEKDQLVMGSIGLVSFGDDPWAQSSKLAVSARIPVPIVSKENP